MGKGWDDASGPSQPVVPPGLRCLHAAAAIASARREAPTPQQLRMRKGVPPNARQQWAEAYTVVGHRFLGACGNARGAGALADVLQALLEFGSLARTVFAYSSSRRSGAAATARVIWKADWLSLKDAEREERPEQNAGPRRPYLPDAQRQAARIDRCLYQQHSIHWAVRAL